MYACQCQAFTGTSSAAGDGLAYDEEDFDELLAASSFGSEQARAVREQTPADAREHARRVLDGDEKCAPVDGDIDDAVSGLVYGLTHETTLGSSLAHLPVHRSLLIEQVSRLNARDLLAAWPSFGPTDSKIVILAACRSDTLSSGIASACSRH